jgi:hypothetical protein
MRRTGDRSVRSTVHGRLRSAVVVAFALAAVVVAIPAAAGVSAGGPTAGKGKDAWSRVPGKPAETKNGAKAEIRAKRLGAYTLDHSAMKSALADAPQERSEAADAQPLVLQLPTPTGGFERFALVESPVMEPALAARHPEIRTYSGKGIDDPTATIRADLTPLGFHASVRSARGGWYIDPYYERDDSLYASYYGRDLTRDPEAVFVEREDEAGEAAAAAANALSTFDVPAGPLVKLRTYRLALLSDPSYADYFGAENVTAAKATLLNRVTQIYEDETAIRMILIADNDKLNLDTAADMIEALGPCGAAPCFTPAQASGCTGGTLSRNRVVIGQLVGASAYEVGHIIFGLPGGGVASLASVGGNAKAQGCTGLPNPVGDYFAVDYVAHELGHQYAGNHTFNGNQHNCSGGNRSQANSVEPGSGSSIMAYAGICRHDNLQPHSDPYWSQRSFQEMTTFVSSTRPAINEVQTVSLVGFDGGHSFRLALDGNETTPIVFGVNYSTAGIKAALESMPGWPAGGIAAVAAWGGTGTLNAVGFQVTFSGTLAQTNVSQLALTDLVGDFSGFVGETAKGGPVDNQGHVVVETDNHAPTVEAPMAYTIPTRTPFALTATATDFDGDTLTYLWEQNDRGGTGTAGGTALVSNTKVNGPLFRQFGTALQMPPYDPTQYESPGENVVTTDPARAFPDLGQILANNTNAVTGTCPAFGGVWPEPVPLGDVDCYSEFLPTADWVGFANDRTLNFRVTARDHRANGGGVGNADTRLTIAPLAGPFLVTSQSSADSLRAGSTQQVTWDVAGTDVAPVSTVDVKISLSVDAGWTYPHVLAASTANDGSQAVVLPNVSTTQARIKVEALGNVFFDVSQIDFEIRDAATQLTELAAYAEGLGPGRSLAKLARSASAKLAAGKVTDACDTLSAFLNEVRAQTGKTLTAAEAAELRLRATTIRTALGC